MIICTNSFEQTATDYLRHRIADGTKRDGLFLLSLSGGKTPLPVYARLAHEGQDLPWSRVIITFGDERCVPPEHADSNFRAIEAAFLSRLPISKENVLRMRGELSAGQAADDYERQIDAVAERLGLGRFQHDLVLLGIGDDGHTASLFPGTEALTERSRRIVANQVPKLGVDRITMTIPFLNASKRVAFLVGDESKRRVVNEIRAQRSHPAAMIQPETGELDWILGWMPEEL